MNAAEKNWLKFFGKTISADQKTLLQEFEDFLIKKYPKICNDKKKLWDEWYFSGLTSSSDSMTVSFSTSTTKDFLYVDFYLPLDDNGNFKVYGPN